MQVMKEIAMQVVNQKQAGKVGTYIGRPSPLGNPFVVGRDGTREEVIGKFRRYVWTEIQSEKGPVVEAINGLTERAMKGEAIVLRCWCTPLACHGEVIVQCIAWAVRELMKENAA